MIRRPLVAGNWKMNGSLALVREMADALSAAGTLPCDVLVCPPAVYLPGLVEAVGGACVGAQNSAEHASGAFTGEVAPSMLVELGVTHVILGHSERRALYGETSEQVAAKCLLAINAGLVPLVCVGETLAERDAGATMAVVERQLAPVLSRLDAAMVERCVIAYEPVWAIGTGLTATPSQAQEVHAFIRVCLAARFPAQAASVRIVYGGSVKASNAAELFACEDIDGGLIGGASLNPAEFLSICRSVAVVGG